VHPFPKKLPHKPTRKLKMKKHHLLLLPGLHGTDSLFTPFLHALPGQIEQRIVRFPTQQRLNYQQLFPFIREAIPWGTPYSILAESFSGPLALLFAQHQRQDIRAIILCASFIKPPLPQLLQKAAAFLGPKLIKRSLPEKTLRSFLLGPDGTDALLDSVKAAIQSVNPEVLAHRLNLVLNTDATSALQDWDRPLLYLRATEDKLVNESALQTILSIKPNTISVDISAPHLLLQSQPAPAANAVVNFLDKLQ